MKVLDKFVTSTGVEVTFGELRTNWNRVYFFVETFNPNSLFDNTEQFLTYDNAFDTFFDIVEQLR